jgi:hypothetical protein
VPRALPGRVSDDPLDDGAMVCSPADGPADHLGQPPVDHQCLAVLAQDDVGRLDVAMDHAPGVGVIDGVADIEEAAEQLAELEVARRPLTRPAATLSLGKRARVRAASMEVLDGLLEAVSPDEPHRVIGAPAAVGAQAVDRDDARVLEAAGDLGLAHRRQAGAGGGVGRHGRQALLHIAVVRFDMDRCQYLNGRPPGAGEVAAGFQMVGKALGLVAGPGLEGGDERALVDQPILKCDQSEEEMAVGGGGHGVAPIVVGRLREGPCLWGRPGN